MDSIENTLVHSFKSKKIRRSDMKPSTSPFQDSNLLDKSAEEQIPERYEILEKLFNSLVSSILLCRMKGSMTTFTNLSTKIGCLTDRRFTHSHLAQIKFILPEAIDIKKILILDEFTSCMKPELLLALDVTATEESKYVPFQNGSILLRKIFRSRLVDFYKAHSEGDEIPAEVLPEPFDASRSAVETKPTFQGASAVTETLQTSPSKEMPLILSHISPSFRRSFSQKAIPRVVTKQGTVSSGLLSPVTGPSFSQTNPNDKCPLFETASPRKLSSNATRDVGTQDEVSSAYVRHSLPFATLVKSTNSDVISNSSAGTPVQCDSTPANLPSATPKSCYITPDNDATKSVNKLFRRPACSRMLSFDCTLEKNAKHADDDEEEDYSSVADDVLDVLPQSLRRSIKERDRGIFGA